jgi:hypothetical protein
LIQDKIVTSAASEPTRLVKQVKQVQGFSTLIIEHFIPHQDSSF